MKVYLSEVETGPERNRTVRLVPSLVELEITQDDVYLEALKLAALEAREKAESAADYLDTAAGGGPWAPMVPLDEFMAAEEQLELWGARENLYGPRLEFLSAHAPVYDRVGFRGETAVTAYEAIMYGLGKVGLNPDLIDPIDAAREVDRRCSQIQYVYPSHVAETSPVAN